MNTTIKQLVPRGVRRETKILRAKAFEAVGSQAFSYPALNRLDRKILPYIGTKPGVFLEIGANDGFSQSNTYHLERHLGWHGILVEPVPQLFDRCRRLRRASSCFNVACVGPDDPDAVEVVDLDLMSVTLGQQTESEESGRLQGRAGRPFRAEATTLSCVIERADLLHVDFMSVDVEGAELKVLAGLDMARHTPTWLLVETAHVETLAEALEPHMILHAQLSHHDYLFRSADGPRRG